MKPAVRARPPFSVGVNYWPRLAGLAMWRDFDEGALRDDVAHVAALGLDTVRFFVRWDDFAPRPDAVDPVMLERLERFVTMLHEAGLGAVPALFCGHAADANFLPAWALDAHRADGGVPTFAGGTSTAHGAGDLYREPLLEAQIRFARNAGERLRGHPAIRAWDLGHAFERVREPSRRAVSTGEHSSEPADERAVAEWSRRLVRELRDASGSPATAGSSMDVLTRDAGIRLGTLCAPFAFASIHGETVRAGFARGRLDPEAIPFLAMLAAGFSHQEVLVAGFGNPTCPGDKFSAFERFPEPGDPPALEVAPDDTAFATFPCLTERENALWCTEVLERLHADGRLGAYWWCWADARAAAAEAPPYDRAPHAATYGIVRADGSEKPVAAALSAFARERRAVVPADDMPAIASAYYYRTLPDSTRTLFDAFLRFVAERRARARDGNGPGATNCDVHVGRTSPRARD